MNELETLTNCHHASTIDFDCDLRSRYDMTRGKFSIFPAKKYLEGNCLDKFRSKASKIAMR